MTPQLHFALWILAAVLVAAVLSYAATPLVKKLAVSVGAMDVPKDNRRMHKVPIPRLGGLAIFVAFVVTVLIFMNLSGTERFMARILGIYFITYNIVRLGEFGALRMAPPEPPARRRRSSSSARRSARYEEEDDGYDVYDYEEDYPESEEDDLYSRNRSFSRYDDLDDDEDYRRYRRERGYDI